MCPPPKHPPPPPPESEPLSPTQPSQPQTARPKYSPDRVYSKEALETLNLLEHPVWVFDIDNRCMGWANTAAVALWNADSLESLLARNFKDDMSEASVLRLQSYQTRFRQGQTMEDVWTFYPNNSEAKTCRIVASGIRTCQSQRNPSMLVEGLPVEQESANFLLQSNPELLRGVEMLRHLPMPVCQFDADGRCMYQNPDAMLPTNNSSSSVGTTNTATGKKNRKVKRNDSNTSVNTVDTTSTDDSSERTQATGPQEASLDHSTATNSSTKNNQSEREETQTEDAVQDTNIGCTFMERFVDPEVGRKALQDLLHHDKNTTDDSHQTRKAPATSKKLDATLHTRLGPRRCEVHLVQAKDPVTGQTVVLFNSRDLTDALEAKREKENSQKKSEFFAIMAHEIRTPLHQVTGFIDLLAQTSSSLSQEQQSFVKTLQSSSSGLMTVINDVLDFSKWEAGKMNLEHISYQPKRVVEGSVASVQAKCEEYNISLEMPSSQQQQQHHNRRMSTSSSVASHHSWWHPENPFQVIGDPNRLRQVLLNLLSNAVKFSPRDGTGRVSLRVFTEKLMRPSSSRDKSKVVQDCHDCHRREMEARGRLYETLGGSDDHAGNENDNNEADQQIPTRILDNLTVTEKANEEQLYLTFEIQDNGVGIAEEQQQAIFKQYQQASVTFARNFGGTGLGLSICKLIMDAMGGEIGVRSQLGEGSTFWFRLPVVLPDSPAETPSKEGVSAKNNGMPTTTQPRQMAPTTSSKETTNDTTASQEGYTKLRILVAEDNKVNQKLITSMLKRMGHMPTICENGKEAVDLAGGEKNNHNSNGDNTFDAILMDIQMPVMDGIEATSRLRDQGCDIPILGLTASVQRCDFLELGFTDWIPKPTRMNVLKEKLAQINQAV